ncbi:Ig-like domain-containing protein [Nocardioides litoris]|uniref:Ig-like domain-containing protein n=1 Tax=Nocardioides litoris TaxID=1926648 RepID=UPI001476C361|nr:Ig-like domain-containing protein [Nocardioides litoris]
MPLPPRPAVAGITSLTVAVGSLLVSFPTASAAPASPSGLQAVGEVQAGLPVLQWRPSAAATTYEVQIDADPDFSAPDVTARTANTSYAHTSVLAAGTQYWRVRAVGSDRSGSAWSTDELTVARTPTPTLTAPTDGAPLPQPDEPPLLQWTTVPGAVRYVVQLDDEIGFAGAKEYDTQAGSMVVADPLSPGKDYFWRVKAVRSTGIESAFSAARSFSVGALATPEIVSPAAGADLTDVVLDWRPVAGARYYDLEVSTDRDFAGIVDTRSKMTGTRYSPVVTYDNNDQYFWRVRAVSSDASVKSAWTSSLNTFRRSWNDAPEPVYPLSTTDQVADPLFFQWTAVAHATQYELQVGDDPNFSPDTFESCQTAATTYTPGQFALNLSTGSVRPELCYPDLGRTNYWRVRPLDLPFRKSGEVVPGVQGLFSATQAFVYQPETFAPDGFSPTNGEVVDVPTLRWHPLQQSQAQSYDVRIFNRAGSQVVRATTYGSSYTPTRKLQAKDGPFRWSVAATEVDAQPGSLGYSNSFQVSDQVPALPGQPLEATSGTGPHLRTPSFAWVPYPGAESYSVRIFRPGTNITIDQNAELMNEALAYNEVTETSRLLLAPGTYEWRVTATMATGSVEGPAHTFSIQPLAAVSGQMLALDGDTLVAGDGCVGSTVAGSVPCEDVPSTPVLSWDPVPGAALYVVYVAQDDRFTNLVEATTAMSATSNTIFTPTMKARASTLEDSVAGASYYWHVRPCKSVTHCAADPVSASTSLATNRFRKKSPAIEGGTATAGTGDGSEVVFSWRDYRDTNGDTVWSETGEKSNQSAQKYELQVSSVRSFATLLESAVVDQPTYTSHLTLYPDGPVFWRVRAADARPDDTRNRLTWSETYLVDKQAPEVTVREPINGARISGSIPLRWAPQAYAQAYQVQVAANNDANFSAENVLFTARTAQTAYTWDQVIPASALPYVWRVRRVDSVGNLGAWSEPRRFTNPGASPSAALPAPGAAVPASRTLFSWSLVPGATTYLLEVREGTRTRSFTTAANAYAPTTAFATGVRQWRVVALDAGRRPVGASGYRSFVVDATAPTVLSVGPRGTVPRKPTLTVRFSERVRGVSAVSVRLVRSGSAKAVPISVSVRPDGRSAVVRPRSKLPRGKSFRMTISAGITDGSGNALRPQTVTLRTKR